MTPAHGSTGAAGIAAEARPLGAGEAIPVALLRDFLLVCARHDAIRDAATERIDRLEREGRLDVPGAAATLRGLVGELLMAARDPDWDHVADALIGAHRDAVGGRGA